MRTIQHIFTLSAFILLSSCASKPDFTNTTTFKTRITDSGLKHFQLTLRPPRREEEMAKGPDLATTSNRERRPGRKSRNNERRIQKQVVKYLDELILNNQYCREGYWIIDTSSMPQNSYIRGECNEAASPEDRERFPDTLHYW